MAITVAQGASFEATLDSAPTGLVGTIGVQIQDGDGLAVKVRTTEGIVESPAGSGVYTASLIAPSPDGEYVIVWDTGGDTPDYATEPLLVRTLLAGAARSSVGRRTRFALGGVGGALVSSRTIKRGDTYPPLDGVLLVQVAADTAGALIDENGLAWAAYDLTGATVALRARSTQPIEIDGETKTRVILAGDVDITSATSGAISYPWEPDDLAWSFVPATYELEAEVTRADEGIETVPNDRADNPTLIVGADLDPTVGEIAGGDGS